MEDKNDTVLVEITGTFINSFGREISPGPLSLQRLTRDRADYLINKGVAKILNLGHTCLRSEYNRRAREMNENIKSCG